MNEKTCADRCRELESKLTAEQKQRAFAIVAANGWKRGDTPPAWVWQEVFMTVLAGNQPGKE